MPAGAVTPGRLDVLAAAISEDDDDPTVQYAATADEAIEAVRARIDDGAAAVAVVPVGLAVDDAEGSLRDPDLLELHRRLDEVGREHPDVELQYVGPAVRPRPRARGGRRRAPARGLGGAGAAGGGDRPRLRRRPRPVRAVHGGAPGRRPGRHAARAPRARRSRARATRRASRSTRAGPGTSDLDIVLIGDEAMAAWAPEAFYLPGVNTQPLYDDARDIASPTLEQARAAAQAVAGRPVALQAMTRWFLDLRSGLQGTPYVVLGG